jgi:hypothetical protein
MRRLLDSKSLFVAPLFMLAFVLSSHGPTMPPDPWAGLASVHTPNSHGPTMPPDPWAGLAS